MTEVTLQKRTNEKRTKRILFSRQGSLKIHTKDSTYLMHEFLNLNDTLLKGCITSDTFNIAISEIENIQIWPEGSGYAGVSFMTAAALGLIATPIVWAADQRNI